MSYCIYIFIASGNLQMVTGEKLPFFFVGSRICLKPRSDSLSAGETEDWFLSSPCSYGHQWSFSLIKIFLLGNFHSHACEAITLAGSSSTLTGLCLLQASVWNHLWYLDVRKHYLPEMNLFFKHLAYILLNKEYLVRIRYTNKNMLI